MSLFQLILLIISVVVFAIFFRQLFSGAFPKRGVDYEAKREDEQIGGITQMDKTFSTPEPQLSRVEQLSKMANEALEKGDFIEADKALSSALILEKENVDLMLQYGFVLIHLKRFMEAKELYREVIGLDSDNDMAHVSLANVLHQLDEDELALEHHRKAIALDPTYAPHYFNYANTLYDLNDKETARVNYQKAFELDPTIEEAERMIKELS
ncbi:MAG TPA: tetratricopeptide repeat protein [Campylobacterales bacterium]|nr:tetratricopeptide repeat protein [Campylobacterales bacterium]